MPPGRLSGEVVLGMSHWEDAPGKTQDTFEGLCLSAGVGTPSDPTRLYGGGETAAPTTQH